MQENKPNAPLPRLPVLLPPPQASHPRLRQAMAQDQPPLNLFPSPSPALITMWRQ